MLWIPKNQISYAAHHLAVIHVVLKDILFQSKENSEVREAPF